MYDEIRDELKEKQEELFSWKAQLEMSLAEAPKGKLYRSACNPQEIFTERGEQVRSKSEKIIADSLYRNGIPYRYEHPVYLRGMGVVHPDFICLHVKKRKEILWEHMGLMGDPKYCRRALKKEEMYIKNGYRSGIDIIYTRESSGYTISTKVIDQIIKDTFL